MSAYPEQRGKGLLFKNFKKRQLNHPDYTGSIEIDGKKFDLAAWIKPLKNGKGKFMSMSVSEPRTADNGLPKADQATETPRQDAEAPAPQQPTKDQVFF